MIEIKLKLEKKETINFNIIEEMEDLLEITDDTFKDIDKEIKGGVEEIIKDLEIEEEIKKEIKKIKIKNPI